jgi:tRNA-2-methylthio-N6-dimethylallyladenosine synthase
MVQRLFVRHIVTETEAMAQTMVQLSTHRSTSSISSSSTGSSSSSNTATPVHKNNNNNHTLMSHMTHRTTNHNDTYPNTNIAFKDPSILLLSSSSDPFATLAQLISSCTYTRDNHGIIGWIDRPTSTVVVPAVPSNINTTSSTSTNTNSTTPTNHTVTNDIISDRVVEELYQLRPKPGDIYVLYDKQQQRYHIVQVMELWMQSPFSLRPPSTTTYNNNNNDDNDDDDDDTENRNASNDITNNNNNNARIGSLRGNNIILPRRKSFRGSGIRSEYPIQPQTYMIQTSGCQMNVADSERLEGILQHDLQLRPWTEITTTTSTTNHNNNHNNNHNMADIVMFNTCSIRDHAEQKLYDALGPYVRAKRQGRQLALIVTGCVAQQEGERLIQRIPEIDAVIGPQYIPYLSNIVDTISYGQQVVVTAPMLIQDSQQDSFLQKPIRGHTVRAWVNIIHGCNEHCTYCVVPGTRGMEQSRTMERILDECIQLQQQGYKEVTLLGQNIDAYGRDMIPKRTFADLLIYLNQHLPNPMRIRYVTSHPRYFSDRVIDAVASLEKVCECFHMPFQAGDDIVLKNMRRGYTYDSYMSIIRKIRQAAPDASICTDIIVGFPGETEDQFQKTLQLMEEVQFDNVNSFVYSPRPNTEAALYTDQIDDGIKSERLQRVQELAIRHGYQRSLRYMNRTVEVLVEDVNPRNSDQVMGRTRQGRQVYFDGDIHVLLGELVPVKITEARTWSLMGEMVV